MLEKSFILSNKIEIPSIMMGTSLCDCKGDKRQLEIQLINSVFTAATYGIRGFDTARDYNNESLLGSTFKKLWKKNGIKRRELFITTKVGNSQQRLKNISEQIDISLKSLKTDYIDLWLLHWPYPDFYIENWRKMEEVYRSGKVRAIGICNCRERHLNSLLNAGISIKPMVVQFEYHPFRTVTSLMQLCKEQNLQVEAYSSLCCMLPFVRENEVLKSLASKYGKSVAQVIIHWHLQQGVIPIFRSFNANRLKSNVEVFDFALEKDDMDSIFALDKNYKFHPESINCPGF